MKNIEETLIMKEIIELKEEMVKEERVTEIVKEERVTEMKEEMVKEEIVIVNMKTKEIILFDPIMTIEERGMIVMNKEIAIKMKEEEILGEAVLEMKEVLTEEKEIVLTIQNVEPLVIINEKELSLWNLLMLLL